MLYKTLFCLAFVFYNVKAACYQYRVPTPSITAYKPRGLAISIPNDTGVELVIFYVSVNRDISNVEADYTQYVVAPINSKWSFDNLVMKVKNGDIVYYKIYVQRDKKGYMYRGTPHIVTERYKRPTSESTQRREEIDDCYEIEQPQTTSTTAIPTTEFITSTTPPSTSTTENTDCTTNLNSVLKLLLDAQMKLESVKNDLEAIREIALTQPLYLRLSGPATGAGDPKEVVEFVIYEKLNTRQSVKSATKNGTTITFELFNFEQKVDILKRAKLYLKDNPNILITV